MKSIDINELDKLPGTRLNENDIFSFKCHSELPCFNQCCRNLNLFLYPYDVIRLKKRLEISSDQFLDKYVDVVLRPSDFFPEVLLSMSENQNKTCIFLTDSGCSVYSDRPDTCRLFPMEKGILYGSETKKNKPIYFFRPPDFCKGHYEERKLTVKEWVKDQDAELHSKMTEKWADVRQLFQNNPWGREGAEGNKAKMAFMAAYNTDRFRDFIFNSTFLKRYKVKSDILNRIKEDETELLKFGFEWIKFYLWGIKSKFFRLR